MPSSSVDRGLRAELHEWARAIIGRDRDARRAGRTQNTIGEIERALIRAYRLGRASLDQPRPPASAPNLGMVWEEVKPRGREILTSLSLRFDGAEAPAPRGLIAVMIDGRERWIEKWADDRAVTRSVASGSVAPLVRDGLLKDDGTGLHVLTPKGRATCEGYWRRRDGDGPTLPKESLRG